MVEFYFINGFRFSTCKVCRFEWAEDVPIGYIEQYHFCMPSEKEEDEAN